MKTVLYNFVGNHMAIMIEFIDFNTLQSGQHCQHSLEYKTMCDYF